MDDINYSLNFYDVQKIAGKNLCLITSPKLINMTPDNLFELSDYVVINYLSSPDYGHWVCLFYDRPANIINFFDSYGGEPDSQLKYIPRDFRLMSNQDYPYLLKLLFDWANKKNGPKIEYNYIKLQNKKATTCGRWIGLYLSICDLIFIDQFGQLIKKISHMTNLDPDQIVFELTKTK